jgi:hypothetical protein
MSQHDIERNNVLSFEEFKLLFEDTDMTQQHVHGIGHSFKNKRNSNGHGVELQ